MLRIKDYSFLFNQTFGTKNNNGLINNIKVSSLSSLSTQQQLKAAGINTNSAQYKAAIKEMSKHPGSMGMSTNPQAIKNLMRNFDANGDYIDPVSGLTGLDATGIPMSQRHKIINISEESKQEIFEATKRAFINDYGTGSGDRGYRSEIYQKCQRNTPKEDRLKASWTLGRYEEAYEKAFTETCLKADPSWQPGKSIPAGALNNVTRESIDNSLVKVQGEYGETFVRRGFDIQV